MRIASLRVDVAAIAALALLLVAALALRLFLLAGPQTELEADEAIVGLMGRHILEGERPIFYYMQSYLGSLEAYLVAGSFALLGSSTFALKLVPLVAALIFVGLVFATGYRVGGLAAAVVSGLYVAAPPAFLALWSLKARGGYIEVLVIGQLLILLAIGAGKQRSLGPGRGALIGFLAGLGVWTNPLVGVYLVPIALYLALALRGRLLGIWIPTAAAGLLAGAYPLIDYNLSSGFETAEAMFGGTGSVSEAPLFLYRFFRHSLPILAGLAQASSSQQFFWPAFSAGLAGWWPAALLLAGLFALLAFSQVGRLLALLLGKPEGADGRSLLTLLLVVVPTAFVLSKFRDLTTEPRYLLPLYSAVPLLAAVLTSSPLRRRIAPVVVAALIALNGYNLANLDPQLNLPDTAIGSTASNRAELAGFLHSRGLDRVYADYWLGYPLAFESRERIVPSVASGGFNRYLPYAQLVSASPDPAFLFVAGSQEESAFTARLVERGVDAWKESVSIYSVYWGASPLDRARP